MLFYFFPHVTTEAIVADNRPRREFFEARGVWSAFSHVRDFRSEVCASEPNGGPGKKPGTLLVPLPADGQPPNRLGYFPRDQHWEENPGGADAWLGYNLAEPPTPERLARRKRFPGYDVELADGNRWEIPILRAPGTRSSLPHRFAYDKENGWKLKLDPSYAELWQMAETAWNYYAGDGGITWDFFADYATACLGLNYRIGRAELSLLGLLDTTNRNALIEATLDIPFLQTCFSDEQKKTAGEVPATPPGTPGPEDSGPTTTPAAAS